eukprot:6200091-Pleurochrysis_carterae.AAC.3
MAMAELGWLLDARLLLLWRAVLISAGKIGPAHHYVMNSCAECGLFLGASSYHHAGKAAEAYVTEKKEGQATKKQARFQIESLSRAHLLLQICCAMDPSV